jgi:hypothetical protein
MRQRIGDESVGFPRHFCWSRFGTEAGERIEEILSRKEKERRDNGGIFLWGIGNAVAPSMRKLVQLERKPQVIFSPIRSTPRQVDIIPELVVTWTAGKTLDGQSYRLPPASTVTSGSTTAGRRGRHYALVCATPCELRLNPEAEKIEFRRLRNLLTNRPVGASQVTAIVRYTREGAANSGSSYFASLRAQLVFPFFIELAGPQIDSRLSSRKSFLAERAIS